MLSSWHLEYLNICGYSRAAGPLRYMQELEQFRIDCPGLPYVMAADSLIRKKIYRLQSEQRETYGSFQEALLEVINNHKYLWNDARTKAVLAKVERKDHEPVREPDQVQMSDSPAKSPNKNKKKRARNKELLKEAKQLKKAQEKDQKPPKVERDKRIPEAEWKSISQAASAVSGEKRCHFYNSSMGCSMGDKRRFKHTCMKCGARHPMVGNH